MGGRFDGIVLASDIDGTYLAMTEEGARRNREAIEYFKANGGLFTFATGRNPPTLLEAVPDAVEIVDLPVICCNGSVIYDLKADKEIAVYPMDHKTVYELQSKFSELEAEKEECKSAANNRREVYYKHKKYINEAVDKYRYELVKENLYEIMPPDEWKDYDIHKVMIKGEKSSWPNTRGRLVQVYGDRLFISQASTRYYEFTAPNVNKATGIEKMLKLCFGDKKITLCVAGDSDNDIEMLDSTDLSFCPENANEMARSVCHKCLCHHNEGLIADIVEYLDK